MRFVLALTLVVGLSGCQTPAKPVAPKAETISALSTVTQGLTNQPVTQAQLKNLSVQVMKDPQARSAVSSINTALSPQHTVKYCPVDGQRFSPDVDICPVHHVKLEWVE